jgi:hypothetical protein
MVAGWDAIDLTDSDSMALIEDPRECIDAGQIALEHVIAHGQVDTFLFAGANLMNVMWYAYTVGELVLVEFQQRRISSVTGELGYPLPGAMIGLFLIRRGGGVEAVQLAAPSG